MDIDNKSTEITPYLAHSKVLPISFLHLLYSTDFGVISREATERELIEVDSLEMRRVERRSQLE